MDEAGQKLKKIRERLQLTYRDVVEASTRLAERHGSHEFTITLGRLSDIENKGTVPTIFKMYSFAAIYRLDLTELLRWYGVDLSILPADAAKVELERTHLMEFAEIQGDVQLPLALDPGIDLRRTTFLSRMIQKWGKLPIALLNGLDLKGHRYGFIGADDWAMYPLIQPTSLVLIDESRRKIVNTGWANEFERPIYFFEHKDGYSCSWCTQSENQLVLQPHPASMYSPQVYAYPDQIAVLGQVTGVAMRLDQGKRRRARA
jgi:transcriptional regulator with XRE-family HTH domain